MNHRQLSYFLEVYEQKSISKAAERLFVPPQGLSKTIITLEKELGVQLFKHKANRITPTSDAARLAIHAKNILDEYDVIENKLFLGDNAIKTVEVYTSYDFPQLIQAAFYQHFNETYPKLRIKIKEFPDSNIVEDIEKNRVELGIVPGPFNSDKFICESLCTEEFCLVVNKEHPLAKYDAIPFSLLSGEKIVVKDSRSSISMNQLYSFEERGIKPNIILETSDVHLIHQMAESGYALGISLRYLADKIRSDSIKVVRFEENWLVKRLYLVRNKNNVLSVEGELFRNAILDYFQLRRETNISQD